MEAVTKSSENPWAANYAILQRPITSDNTDRRPKMIGAVGVVNKKEVAEGVRFFIGYMINHDYWGYGYATEALGAFLDLWFNSDNSQTEELIAEADTENWASIRILQKMRERGYQVREGELQRAAFNIPSKGLRDMRMWHISKSLNSS
jgi:RimJ/RimL family protein N-acetyltransferase